MEHPLISNLDDLSLDQLTEKITDLNKKLAIASRAGNFHVCNQLRMALESYQNTYNEKSQRGSGGMFDEVIDIS